MNGSFERIYEDIVSGKLSDERFAKMSSQYEAEQRDLFEKIKVLRSEMDKLNSQTTIMDMFNSIICKYTRAKKLTPVC